MTWVCYIATTKKSTVYFTPKTYLIFKTWRYVIVCLDFLDSRSMIALTFTNFYKQSSEVVQYFINKNKSYQNNVATSFFAPNTIARARENVCMRLQTKCVQNVYYACKTKKILYSCVQFYVTSFLRKIACWRNPLFSCFATFCMQEFPPCELQSKFSSCFYVLTISR